MGLLGSSFSSVRKTITDFFERPNQSGLGNAEDGSRWNIIRPGFNVVNGKAEGTDSNYPMAVFRTSTEDVTISLYDVSNGSSAALWVSDLNNWWAIGIEQEPESCNCQTGSSCTAYNANSRTEFCTGASYNQWVCQTSQFVASTQVFTNLYNAGVCTQNQTVPGPCAVTAWNASSCATFGGGNAATWNAQNCAVWGPAFCIAWNTSNCAAWNAQNCVIWGGGGCANWQGGNSATWNARNCVIWSPGACTGNNATFCSGTNATFCANRNSTFCSSRSPSTCGSSALGNCRQWARVPRSNTTTCTARNASNCAFWLLGGCNAFGGGNCSGWGGGNCSTWGGGNCANFGPANCSQWTGGNTATWNAISCAQWNPSNCSQWTGGNCALWNGSNCVQFIGPSCSSYNAGNIATRNPTFCAVWNASNQFCQTPGFVEQCIVWGGNNRVTSDTDPSNSAWNAAYNVCTTYNASSGTCAAFAYNAESCAEFTAFTFGCQTCYPQYIRLMQSASGIVSEVFKWAITTTIKSLRIKTKGDQITISSFSDINLNTQIGSDIIYTPTGVNINPRHGITIQPSPYQQDYTIGGIKIERN